MADPIYQNPTFGKIKTKTADTVTEAEFLGTIETDGSIAKIDPENLPFVNKVGEVLTNSIDFDPLLSQDPTDATVKKRVLQPESTRLDPTLAPIYGWGDSLTNGFSVTNYPTQLTVLFGFPVTDKGIGGETSTQIKNRLVADTGNYSKSVIIWAGRNNYTDPTTVKADIATMISTIGHSRYLVVGILNRADEPRNSTAWTNINALNADLKALYGNKYVAIREFIVSQYNPALPQDVIDHDNDVTPTSLRIPGDQLHLNTSGYAKVAEFFNQRLGNMFDKNGYFQSKDFKYYLNTFSVNTGSGANGQVAFWTGANTQLGNNDFFWDNSTKRLGIFNTIAPQASLDVSAEGSTDPFKLNVYSNTLSMGGISSVRYGGTRSAPTATLADMVMSGIISRGYYASSVGSNSGAIRIMSKQDFTNVNQPTYIDFATTPIGSTSRTVRFKIDSDGALNIATTPVTSAGSYRILTQSTSTNNIESISSTAVIGGSGTINTIPKFGTTSTLTNSTITDSGTSGNVSINNFITGSTTRVIPAGTTALGQTLTLTGSATSSRFINNTSVIMNEDGFGSNVLDVNGAAGGFITLNKTTNQSASYNGIRAGIIQNSTANYARLSGVSSEFGGTGTGTVTEFNSFIGAFVSANTNTITDYYGVNLINSPQNNVTNARGFFVGNLYGSNISRGIELGVTAGTGKYNVYALGTAINYMNGALLLGTNTDNTVDKLQVTGTASGTVDATVSNQFVRKGQLDLKADLASPALTGTPTAPTATVGTNTTQLATTAFVQANSRPYKVYTALVTQSGTSAPTVKILENNTGLTITPSYSSVGTFWFTYSVATAIDKVFGVISDNNNYSGSANVNKGLSFTGTDKFIITTQVGGALANGLLLDAPVEIRIYP